MTSWLEKFQREPCRAQSESVVGQRVNVVRQSSCPSRKKTGRSGWRFGCEGSLKHQCQKNQSHDNQHAGRLDNEGRLSKKFSQRE